MKKLLLAILFSLVLCGVKAQLINTAWLYEPFLDTLSINSTNAIGSYIDNTGNRYTVISAEYGNNDTLILYGETKPILITRAKGWTPYRLIVLKFDKSGKLLFHFSIFAKQLTYINSFNMSFDADNNPLLFYSEVNQTIQKSSHPYIDLLDANQQLYKRINFPDSNEIYRIAVLCKLDTLGNFKWTNTIKYKCPLQLGNYWTYGLIDNKDRGAPSIIINSNQEINIYLDVANTYNNHSIDTLTLTNTQGQSSELFANNIDVFLRFSSSGNFIKMSEPFKNLVNNVEYDTYYLRSYSAVSDGINTYSIYSINNTKPGVFSSNTPIQLKKGINTLLIKRNAQDSIIWARYIRIDSIDINVVDKPNDDVLPQYIINFDPYNKEIILSTYTPYTYYDAVYAYTYLINSSTYIKPNSIYLSRFDINGIKTWDYLIERGGDKDIQRSQIISATYNNVLKQLIVVGGVNASLNTFSVGSFTFDLVPLKNKYVASYFVAIFDNTNKVIYAQLIKQKSINIDSFNGTNGSRIIPSNFMVDNVGRTYITFKNINNNNSYDLSCNPLVPQLARLPRIKKLNNVNRILYFENLAVMVLDPLIQLDSNICKSMKSPSKKYIWNKSGIYYDTLINSLGCDSLLLFNIKIAPIPFKLTLSKTNNISCDSTFTNLSAKGGRNYAWYPTYELSDTSISNPVASPKKDITYYVIANDSMGCTAIDSIHIDVNKDEKIKALSNVFTPNNDGLNDCLSIESVANFKEVETSIFNRWGNEVFNSRNTNACWNGKSSANEDFAEGTYFYIIKGQTQCQQKVNQNGSITLIR